MSLTVGSPLGHYDVAAKIGEGGMGGSIATIFPTISSSAW